MNDPQLHAMLDERQAVATEAVARMFALLIRADDDPDHSGPEDEALAYTDAVIEAALTLFFCSNPRKLPRVLVTCPVD